MALEQVFECPRTLANVEIDMKMKRQMIEKAGAPAMTKARQWKKSAVLEWLNRLANTRELC